MEFISVLFDPRRSPFFYWISFPRLLAVNGSAEFVYAAIPFVKCDGNILDVQ